MRRERLIELILVLVTAAAYAPLIHYGFINYDDAAYLVENPQVQHGLTASGLHWAATTVIDCNWHPVTWVSHMLDCELFGVKAAGHHATNLLLHVANALLVFHLWRRMTRNLWSSALVAALFALHPLQVESVAWIFERKGVLSSCFGLLSLWAYVNYVDAQPPEAKSKCRGWYLFALVAFALGLMSKSMIVTWPFVLLLLDFWPLQRLSFFPAQAVADLKSSARTSIQWLFIEKLPFFALTAASCIATLFALRHGGAMVEMNQLGLGERFGNAMISYARYLGKFFWPADLAILYPHPPQLPTWQIAASMLLLAAVTVAFVWQIRRRPFLIFGWLWFLGTLVPAIGLVQIGSHAMADRYMYVPSIGLFVIIAWLVKELVARWPDEIAKVGALVATLLIGCLVMTRVQLGYWRSSETLFRHTLEITESNVIGEFLLGDALVREGKLNDAMEHLDNAIRMKPRYAAAHAAIADIFLAQGKTREAVEHYREGIAGRPGAYKLLNNLAWILATDKDPSIRNGAEAVQLAERACELTHYQIAVVIGTLAAAYAENGQFDEAIAAGEKARELAIASGEKEIAETNTSLLDYYRNHRPYHQPGNKDEPLTQPRMDANRRE